MPESPESNDRNFFFQAEDGIRDSSTSRGLGVESYGLSVSEAQQNYNEKKDALPKLAFCMAPMSFNFNLGNR